MRAMLLERQAPIESAPLAARDVPAPEPGPGEVRVKVRACGLCRTDLHVVEGDLPPRKLPLIPGHQVVGTVDRRGKGAARFKEGDRIGIAWLRHTDGTCGYCRSGRENLCEASTFTGYHADGGYAEYAVVPEAFAYALPDVFDDAEATPLLCAGIIGYRSFLRSNTPDGGRLGMWGFGSSAHITIQVARARGIEVYVATRDEKHQRLARELGATWVGGGNDDLPVKVKGGILFAPAGGIVPRAMRSLDKGGTLAIAGIWLSPIPELDYERELFYEKNLRSVTANTREDGEGLLREAASIPIRPRVETMPLEKANEGLRRLKDDDLNGTGVLVP